MDDIVRDPRNHSPSKYLEDREDWQSRIIALEDEVKRLREMVGLPKKTGLDELYTTRHFQDRRHCTHGCL